MIFIFLSGQGFVKEAVETLRKIISKGTLAFFLYWTIEKSNQRAGRINDHILAFRQRRSHAGGPFGWCLVRPFNARCEQRQYISNYGDLTY